MDRRLLALALLTLAVGMVSCRKEKLELTSPNAVTCNTYSQQFEVLWHGMDQSYLFWEYDTVDWDARYAQYRPLFEEFDQRESPVPQEEYAAAIAGLFRGLLDHHLYVAVRAPRGNAATTFRPSTEDYESRPYYHENASVADQLRALRRLDGISDTAFWYGDRWHKPLFFALLPDGRGGKIAYLRFFRFDLTDLWENRDTLQSAAAVLEPLKRFYGARLGEGILDFDGSYGWAAADAVTGIVIDVRNNGGGNSADLFRFIAPLSTEERLLGYTRVKEGPGRLDYSAWAEFRLTLPAHHLATQKPIVVLADLYSGSCADLTALAIKELPNGTFIGERTRGGTCPLAYNSQELFYSGIFGDYDKYGYYVYTSFMFFVTADHKVIEGIGVEPDIEVLYDKQSLAQGEDRQLNRALQFLRTGN